MSKRIIALIVAIVVPIVLFILVVSLNESSFEQDESDDRQVSFDVKKQKQLTKPKPKPKPKPNKRESARQLPSIKPSDIGSSLTGSGLSFGIPQFDETEFSDIADGGLLDSMGSGPMDKDTVDTAPRVVKRSPIVYPELARRQGISGYVTMNVLINESGNVEDVEIVDSRPVEIFDLKADSTIRRWRFEPATYNGKKVKVWAMQKIVFKLD